MTSRLLPLAGLALATATADSSALSASDIDAQIVLRVGDTITGVGDVATIREVTIDDLGNWIADVNTDFPNNDEDDAIVRNGDAYLVEGADLALPLDAVIDAFDDLDGSFTDAGDPGWILNLDGPGLSGAAKQAVYQGTTLILQGGDDTLVAGMPAGTTWGSFLDVKANEADQLLVMASVNDPVQGFVRALVRLQLDGNGGILTRELIAYPGQIPAGQGDSIQELEFGIHEFAMSDGGHVIAGIDLTGSPSFDNSVLLDGVLVAREGGDSPVPGRPWQVLTNPEVDVNVHGDYVLTGILTGVNDDDTLIERSGEVLVREADVLPGISPFQLTSVGLSISPGPIHLGDNGNVLWFGTWDDPDTTVNRGLFLNDRLLVQQNVTVISGEVITLLEGTVGSYALSDSGEFVVFRARVTGNDHVTVVIDIGPWTSLGGALAGAGGSMPELTASGPLTGNSVIDLAVNGGLASAAATLVIGFSELSAPFKGGVMVPQTDLLVPLLLDGQGATQLALPLPPVVPAAVPFYFQTWIQDGAGPVGFSATNAVLGVSP